MYAPKNLSTVSVVLASRGPLVALEDLIRHLNTPGLKKFFHRLTVLLNDHTKKCYLREVTVSPVSSSTKACFNSSVENNT